MISPDLVNDALQCLARHGIDARDVLSAAGLPAVVLEPVSAEEYGALWRAVSVAIDDEFFGQGDRPMRAGSFSLLCHSVLLTDTLEQALRRTLRFLRVVIDEPFGELLVDNGLAQIVLTDRSEERPPFAYRTYWIIVHGVMSWLVGRPIPLKHVDFRCSPPPRRAHYPLFYGAPTEFSQPTSRLVFDASYLQLPTVRDKRALREFLKRTPGNILVRYQDDGGVAAKIRKRLRATAPVNWPSFEDLAAQMKVPASTLRRRLHHEGLNYRFIKEEILRKSAIAGVLSSDHNIAELAAHLGFSEPSAFYRAFRKWTGTSPTDFRRQGPKEKLPTYQYCSIDTRRSLKS